MTFGPADNGVHDDETVSDGTNLYRRISPQFIKRDGDTIRVSGGAFQNTTGTESMSVSLGDTLASERRTPDSLLDEFDGFGLVALAAGYVRGEEQIVQRSRTDADSAHGDVIGRKPSGRRKRFAANCCWVVTPI
jgi:hypothetical protein